MKRTLEPISDWTVWDPVKGRSKIAIRPRLMTIHTAVTNNQDIYGPGLGPGRTHAHFYNPESGTLRQHQDINRKAFADGGGNSYCVSVEHWDGYPNGAPGYWRHGSDVPPLTDSQIENDARLFAHLVTHFGVPNRIATPGNLTGLGWHRLGISGNFGAYDPNDRKTWSRAQSGANFSNARGKVCPGDRRIDQIQEIYDRAQEYLTSKKPAPTPSKPATPEPTPDPVTKIVLPKSHKDKAGIDRYVKALGYSSVRAYQAGQRYMPGLKVDGFWGPLTQKHCEWVADLQKALNRWQAVIRLGRTKVDGDYGNFAVRCVDAVISSNFAGAYTRAVKALYGRNARPVNDKKPGKAVCKMLGISTHPMEK